MFQFIKDICEDGKERTTPGFTGYKNGGLIGGADVFMVPAMDYATNLPYMFMEYHDKISERISRSIERVFGGHASYHAKSMKYKWTEGIEIYARNIFAVDGNGKAERFFSVEYLTGNIMAFMRFVFLQEVDIVCIGIVDDYEDATFFADLFGELDIEGYYLMNKELDTIWKVREKVD